MEKKAKRLSFGEKLAYGMGDCGANVVVTMCGTFLTAYYTDTVGIAAAAVGTMMLISRIFDGITDILMGTIVDKTRTKWGKARPWLLWTAPFMGLSVILLFNMPLSLSYSGKLVWAYLTYIFQSCIVYTANNLPYNALLSRMTLNVHDRAGTATLRFVMTLLTTLIINAVTANLLKSVGWFKLSVAYGIIACAMCIICFIGCKEHIDENQATGNVEIENVPLKKSFPALMKNKYFFIQSLLFLFLYVGIVSTGSLTYYFCNSVLGNLGVMTLTSMASTIPAIIVNLVLPNFIYKYGKWKLMVTGAILMVIGSLLVGFAGANVPLVIVGLVIKGIGMGPIMSGIFAMTADVVDYGEWKTGVRSEGLVNSCTSFGMKVGIGVGSALGTWIIALGGYDGMAAEQTQKAISSIRFGFGYNGAIISLICLGLCFAMNIDKYIVQIQTDLEKKHS
ncbi:MAG: MFS transporter [Pseudobutyrivibrio sp.]|nr:MFS transporter [Pseudobutyrivibrio sp.]